jgi:hypothetical protein
MDASPRVITKREGPGVGAPPNDRSWLTRRRFLQGASALALGAAAAARSRRCRATTAESRHLDSFAGRR